MILVKDAVNEGVMTLSIITIYIKGSNGQSQVLYAEYKLSISGKAKKVLNFILGLMQLKSFQFLAAIFYKNLSNRQSTLAKENQ
jgi:hypothetical protein